MSTKKPTNKVKYNLPKTAQDLETLINSAVRAVNSGRDKLQVASVAVLYHAYKHGDYTSAGKLVMALADSGIRRNSLVEWFKVYGGLVVNENNETNKEQPFSGWKGADYIKDQFEQAKLNMWYNAKKEADPFVELDLQADLTKLLTKYGKKIEQAKAAGNEFRGKIHTKIHQETIDQLMSIAGSFDVVEAKDEDIIAALTAQVA